MAFLLYIFQIYLGSFYENEFRCTFTSIELQVMITVPQAIQLVEKHTIPTSNTINIPTTGSLGHVIAKDVVSPINMPPFKQSAMDGYALGSINQTEFSLVGEIKAGDAHMPEIKEGEAIRIFTGAPVPPKAMAVVMQEKVDASGTHIKPHVPIVANANIRPMGEQIKTGDIALQKGTKITASGIGYLATLGITHVEVYKKPSVGIITTGNELVSPGQSLKPGQIYESNSSMLTAALYQSGITEVSCYKVVDEYDATRDIIESAVQKHEMILVSGGISVGDYDFVGKALRELNVTEIFYKVKQKPGKPLFYAIKEDKNIFALPGNPASSLSCFYIYVLPALLKYSGFSEYHLQRSKGLAQSKYIKKGQRAEFLKAICKEGKVTILDGQASSMLRSFALSNALVYLPEDITEVNPGDTLEIINLP